MQGRHFEYASSGAILLFGYFKVGYLKYDRQVLDKENGTQNRQEQLFAYEYGKDRYNAAYGEASRVAHKYLRGIGVIP